jgi:hypothetical protein
LIPDYVDFAFTTAKAAVMRVLPPSLYEH